jgi:hypothetical protein
MDGAPWLQEQHDHTAPGAPLPEADRLRERNAPDEGNRMKFGVLLSPLAFLIQIAILFSHSLILYRCCFPGAAATAALDWIFCAMLH